MADTVGFIMPSLIKIFANSLDFVSFQPPQQRRWPSPLPDSTTVHQPAQGELIDVIVKEVEASNQSNSQGAANADVPAEESQVKEGAWEVFEG